MPIGMFGFLAALAGDRRLSPLLLIARGGGEMRGARRRPPTLPNGAMVERFDSYVYRVAARAFPRPRRPRSTRSAQSCRR